MKPLPSITDPDVQLLASISLGLQSEYETETDDIWAGSPFAWILKRPSRQRGKIGEQLIAGWCAARDLNVLRSPDSQADRIIEGRRTEVKFSTLWQNGTYVFQQLRDQNYELLVCLGVSPFDAHGWMFRKADIPFHQLPNQHAGNEGVDTWWMRVYPDNPPHWLTGQSGRLAAVYETLSGLRSDQAPDQVA